MPNNSEKEISQLLKIQVNYYIIRTTYDIVNKYVIDDDPDYNFYDLLGVSKASYDKLVNKGCEYKIEKKVKTWQRVTGIDYKIFTGEECFKAKGLDYDELSSLIEDEKQKIREILKTIFSTEIYDHNLQALILFSKKKKEAAGLELVKKRTGLISKAVATVDLKQLILFDENDLSNYISNLEIHLEMCKAARVFVKYQQETNDKNRKS